ncbi:MAG: hypothetical protein WC710_13465 [Gallionella sp.]|jgi:hypothetical protein
MEQTTNKTLVSSLYEAGNAGTAISTMLGISATRVYQLLRKSGVKIRPQAFKVDPSTKAELVASIRNRKEFENFGCSKSDMKQIQIAYSFAGKDPLSLYHDQKYKAMLRGIAWEFNFKTWMDVWIESGCWFQRGKRRGEYVMSRRLDQGPYSPENVKIITTENNLSEYHLTR